MPYFIDHTKKTVYIRASATSDDIKAAYARAYALGYQTAYLLGSALKGAA